MNGDPSDELTPREREAYEALSDPAAPPPECETRIVAALREEGLIGRVRRRETTAGAAPWWRRIGGGMPRFALAGAALAVTFVLGVQYGRGSSDARPTGAGTGVDAPAAPEASVDPNGTRGSDAPGDFRTIDKTNDGWIDASSGEMVASARFAATGFRPDRPLAGGAPRKPPITSGENAGFGEFPPYPLDGSAPSFSPRYP